MREETMTPLERVQTVVNLEQPVPVHILYRTAWVSPKDEVHFREDLYGRDRILIKALLG